MKCYEGLLLSIILIAQFDTKLRVLASPSVTTEKEPFQADDSHFLDINKTRNPAVANKNIDQQFCPDGYECAPLLSCNTMLQPEDVLLGNNSNVSLKCPGQLDICCYKNSQNKTLPSTDSRVSLDETKCGIRNVGGLRSRISSNIDDQADFGEFPWMVTVLTKNYTQYGDQINVYQGGGALIHPSVVLTAAHRVHRISTNSLRVRAGEWDTTTKNDLRPHQDRDVAQVVIHDSFNPDSLRNDVALVFLVSPVNLADNIRPICLPPADYVADYRRCITAGWGKDSFTINATYAPILRKVNVPVVPLSECEAILKTTRLGKYFELHDSFVCAGGEEGKDSCNGDGGSPLVCSSGLSRNQFYQVGIVAWGIGCGTNNIPGVYSNVAKFRGWIDKIMLEKGLTTDSYTSSTA